jgi:hypothetical protein
MCGKHEWRILSKRSYTIMERTINESMLVGIMIILKKNIKSKNK